jgi:hypothetical protein
MMLQDEGPVAGSCEYGNQPSDPLTIRVSTKSHTRTRSGRFSSWGRACGAHWTGDWLGPTVSLDLLRNTPSEAAPQPASSKLRVFALVRVLTVLHENVLCCFSKPHVSSTFISILLRVIGFHYTGPYFYFYGWWWRLDRTIGLVITTIAR